MRLLVDLEQVLLGLLLGAIAFSAFKWAWKRLTSAGPSSR